MVLSVHPDVDLEGFIVLIECCFAPALHLVDAPDIMVQLSHVWMFLAMQPEPDLEAFLVLKQRVFVVTLPLVD